MYENAPFQQCVAILHPNEELQLPFDKHIRIDRFSLLPESGVGDGHRAVIMSHVLAKTSDQRCISMDVAIASFIVGQDFDQSCNIILAPSDKCVLSIVGAPVTIQILYSKFSK